MLQIFFLPLMIVGTLFSACKKREFGEVTSLDLVEGKKVGFFIKPYLQPGYTPTRDRLSVVWFSGHGSRYVRWTVKWREVGEQIWKSASSIETQDITYGRHSGLVRFDATLQQLPLGKQIEYQVQENDEPPFEAVARTSKSSSMPYRFAVLGDMGDVLKEQRKVIYQAWEAHPSSLIPTKTKPDLLCVLGDVVQKHGRIDEYLDSYFSVLNADESKPSVGAPMLRSIPSIATAGNHDTAYGDTFNTQNLEITGDTMAWFLFWMLPLNGPFGEGNKNIPTLQGSESLLTSFRKTAGKAFPQMSNYSYDYGDVHWLVLDANTYVDVNDPQLRKFIVEDLNKAQHSKWKFVAFHQPGFFSGDLKGKDGQMALLANVFSENGVDIVFSGHTHLYERTAPIKVFEPKNSSGNRVEWQGSRVAGNPIIDEKFDGINVTKPEGVIYLVSGAGGGRLMDASKPQSYSRKIDLKRHSYTQIDVVGNKLEVQQIAGDGTIVDKFIVTK